MNNVTELYINDLTIEFKKCLIITDYKELEKHFMFLSRNIGNEILISKRWHNLIEVKDKAYSRCMMLGDI